MWDLGNRGVIVWISVLSGCALVYNVWGPFLVLTVSLFLAVYACYSLIVNDSLLSPHAFLLFEYCKRAAVELGESLRGLRERTTRYALRGWQNVRLLYHRRFFAATMDGRRRTSGYQLSTDSYAGTRSGSSRFGLIGQLSPIPRAVGYKPVANEEDSRFYRDTDASAFDRGGFDEHTSTPMYRGKKESARSENADLSSPRGSQKKSPMHAQNHTLSRGENTTFFSPEGSPWGTSISPKMRAKAGGVKTVQTVAGPLLASTRYNIDPKIYNDVKSPGLTTRLTKYATEANTKLTHQSRYGTGQFPKVNLHASPVPSLNCKAARARTPVTVRVAPPDVTRYSPPNRQSALSKVCHVENKSPPSVAQALRDISLKRHASREDVAAELAKKQRTDVVDREEFESSEEGKQKRGRDESSRSEEDASPQNKSVRPTKRTKTPSCYDVINSLSSSIHVVSGVKRKAKDFSRSGTPDFEKHFKSLESVQNTSVQTFSPAQGSTAKQTRNESKERIVKTPEAAKVQETSPVKGILKTSRKNPTPKSDGKDGQKNYATPESVKTRSVGTPMSAEMVNLTEKLFMRAEPEKNEKLRMLVREQGTIKPKFTSDDVEEIKKEDIVNMRQTSMKARLKSMFDAISGKAASRINPDVVIQAEDVSETKSSVPSPVTCATLNSSTTTTNVNTTPISTSAIAPAFSSPDTLSKPVKHVAFDLSGKESSSSAASSVQPVNIPERQTPVIRPASTVSTTTKSEATPATNSAVASAGTSSMSPSSPSITSGNFAFGKPSAAALTSAATFAAASAFSPVSSSGRVSAPVAVSSPVSAATRIIGNTVSPAAFTPAIANVPKAEGAALSAIKSAAAMSNAQQPATPMFAFGSKPANPAPTPANVAPSISAPGATTATENKNTANAAFSSPIPSSDTSRVSAVKSIASTAFQSPASTTPTPANFNAPSSAPSLFSFGNKSTSAPTPPKPATFAFASSGSLGGKSVTVSSTAGSPSPVATGGFSMVANNAVPVFGSSAASPSFSFGKTAGVPSTTSDKPAFAFCGPTSAPASGILGGTATASTTVSSGASQVFVGGPSNAAVSAAANATPSFAAPSTKPVPKFAAGGPSIFSAATTSASIFGSSSASSAFGAPKTVSATVFGPTLTSTPATTGTASVFGSVVSGASSTAMTTTASATSFSYSNPTASTSATTSAVPTTTSVFAARGNVFAQAKQPSAFGGVGGGGGASGGAAAAAAAAAVATAAAGGTGSVFGNNNGSVFGWQGTTSAPTFGTSSVTSSATAPAFSSTNTAFATPGTSAQKPPATQTFGTAETSSMFGANTTSAPNVFGATTTGTFNASALNPFGECNANSTFGTPSSLSSFVENKPSVFSGQSTAGSAFGAPSGTSATTTSAFEVPGPSNSAGTTTGNVFSFGGAQKPAQNSTFAFGGSAASATGAASASTPFQFAASTSKPASGGFNFTAPTSTPSINFGATGTGGFNATPGMFSIGSGSTAPRSRNGRQRKPR